MTVREFLEVVPFSLVDYARIYENKWDEDREDYTTNNTGKRVEKKQTLNPIMIAN